jgi:leader peptidase (prepilin peptidase)/N-methyltransferase
LHHTLTGRQGLGFGDMKLLAAIGAWLGVAAIANVLIVACALAFGYVIFLKIKVKQLHGRMVPFGPFLAAAATLVLVTEFDFGRWLVG